LTGFHRSRFRIGKAKKALQSHLSLIYDIFEGTAEIQQLVIARAISGMHIK
jgi:alkylation response protein AidB-like acyl-CoA dehydrogenase